MSGQHVEGERAFQILCAGIQQQIGHRGADDVSATAQATDLFGDVVQLALSARRDDDIGAGFREGDRGRRAQTAPGSRDYCYLIVEPESVEDHPGRLTSPRRRGTSGPAPDDLGDRRLVRYFLLAVFLAGAFL